MVILHEGKATSLHIGVESDDKSPNFSQYSPLNGHLLSVFPLGRQPEVKKVIENAKKQYPSWSDLTFDQRGLILRKACKLLEENAEHIIRLVRAETGKSELLARGELSAAIDFGYLISSHGKLPIGTVLPSAIKNRNIQVTRVPRGVCALIVSFNTPLPNYAWKVFPALLSGNVVILKPSPYTALSAKYFAEILLMAGVTPHAIQVLQGDGETGNQLVQEDVDLISFTGSNEVGSKIISNSKNKFAKMILELGGSNPFIVFHDADIEQAVKFAIHSCFSNSGQRCAAASRILLHASIAEEFTEKIIKSMRGLTYGTADDCFLGPVISKESALRLKQFLADCIVEGGEVVALGILDGSSDWVVQPSLVLGLNPKNSLSKQEIFGPITRVFTFQTEDEAIYLANGTEFGLTAAVWTSDSNLSYRISEKVNAGVININGPTHGAEPNMPFGGFGASGNGTRDAGVESLESYSDIKVITIYRHQD
jgi:aldehyde dehydrogenase (NAD+)